jgi:hypothetical protein
MFPIAFKIPTLGPTFRIKIPTLGRENVFKIPTLALSPSSLGGNIDRCIILTDIIMLLRVKYLRGGGA